MAKDLPVVLCEVTADGGWRFWCPFCKVYHLHGNGPGHRWAHCVTDSNSPFMETGYILKKDPK